MIIIFAEMVEIIVQFKIINFHRIQLIVTLHSYSIQGDMHTCSVHSVTVSKYFGVQREAVQPGRPAVTHQGLHWSEAVQ